MNEKHPIEAVVLAGNYVQFFDWVNRQPNKIRYHYICDSSQIDGLHGIPIIRVGEYWKSPLEELLKNMEVLP